MRELTSLALPSVPAPMPGFKGDAVAIAAGKGKAEAEAGSVGQQPGIGG